MKRRRRNLRQARPAPPAATRGLTSKVRLAIEHMVKDGMARNDAALAVGLRPDSLYRSFRNPIVRRYFDDETEALRTSARPRAFHRIMELAEGATSEKVSLDASKFVVNGPDRAPRNVINLGIGVQVQPGWIVDVSQHRDKALEILKAAGSNRHALLDVDYTEEKGNLK